MPNHILCGLHERPGHLVVPLGAIPRLLDGDWIWLVLGVHEFGDRGLRHVCRDGLSDRDAVKLEAPLRGDLFSIKSNKEREREREGQNKK